MGESASTLSVPAADRSAAGVALLLAGVLVFSVGNVIGKPLVDAYPVGEVLAARSMVALVLALPFLRRGDLGVLAWRRQGKLLLARMSFSAIETMCFYWALGRMGLADITALYLAGPIYVTAMAAILLRERVGVARWLAVAAGFAGVLVAVRPSGDAPLLPSMAGLIGSLLYAGSLVITRQIRTVSNAVLVTTQLVALLTLGCASAALGWRMPGMRDAALMAALGVCATLGYVCVNRAFQLAPASLLAPFGFSSIVWSVTLGFLVFGEQPVWTTWAGAAMIVASGMFIVLSKRS